jgi:hypothetical protein
MVLKVPPDRGQRVMNRDANAAQMLRRPDAGKLQNVRRIDGTGGEDDFTLGIHALNHPAPLVLDRDSAAAVKDDAVDPSVDDDLKVGPLLRRP